MKRFIISLFIILTFASCGSMDDINTNPDKPSTVTPAFLATDAILAVTNSASSKWLFGDAYIVKTTMMTEHMEWYMYNKFDRLNNTYDSFMTYNHYSYLINMKKMVALANANESIAEGVKNAYFALSEFMQAYIFYGLTMEVGDIPCSEALHGEDDGILSPKYDTQEEVFNTILKKLRKASELFGNASTFSGDPIYSGDPVKWQKMVNTFTLRVLNMLSKKKTVGDINVQSMFEEFANKSLMTSEADSFMRTYSSSKSAQWYPFYYLNQNYWSYPVMTSFFIDMMKELNDRRIFYYCEPATALNAKEDSYDAYSGVDCTMTFGRVQQEYNDGLHSSINKRYFRFAQGEPIKFVAYSELQLILAEAALRGWKTPLTAKEHYDNGIRAAMMFTTENTPEEYRHGVTINDNYIDDYLAGPAAFDIHKGLEQIMTQKLIGSYVQLSYNSYFDYRRTGYPVLPINAETNMNEVKTQLPLRWMYPEYEYSQNKENIQSAIQRQYGGEDTPNNVMWLLK